MKVLIIIPAYNEEQNIEKTVNDVKTNTNYDYVVINDCSKDKTKEVCEKNNFNMLSLPINYGLTSGIQLGMKYAYKNNYDIAIQFDGDGQHQPKFLKDLVNEIENEVWKDIDDYEGLYQVSNLGRIKRIYPYEHLISNSKNSKGYYTVGLTKNNIRKNKMVHRLVAKAFILNPDNKKEVDHININRTDNRVENLKWVTHKENCNNPISKINYSNTRKGKTVYVYTNEQRKAVSERMKGFKHSENSKLLMSYNRKGSKNSRALKVIQYSLNNEFIKEWEYIKQASEELGVCYSSIINCCKGKRKTAGGFIWKYQNDYKVNGIFNR